jgi:hypothetical protein
MLLHVWCCKCAGKVAAGDVAQQTILANFTAFNVHYYYIGELTELTKMLTRRGCVSQSLSPSEIEMAYAASLPSLFPVGPNLNTKPGLEI